MASFPMPMNPITPARMTVRAPISDSKWNLVYLSDRLILKTASPTRVNPVVFPASHNVIANSKLLDIDS